MTDKVGDAVRGGEDEPWDENELLLFLIFRLLGLLGLGYPLTNALELTSSGILQNLIDEILQ